MTQPARFETYRPMLLAGLRRWYAFAEGPALIPGDWTRFAAMLPLPGQVGDVAYGATCAMDPTGARFEYMAAVEVESFDGLPEGLGRMRVPEAHYAVFAHEGPVSALQGTIRATHAWLGETRDWIAAPTPDFERYGPGFDPMTAQGDIEIWVPVTKAG